jgi:hypothetical protein
MIRDFINLESLASANTHLKRNWVDRFARGFAGLAAQQPALKSILRLLLARQTHVRAAGREAVISAGSGTTSSGMVAGLE